MHETHPVFPSVGEWTKAMFGPFASVMTGGAPARPPEPEPLQEMIRDLQRQVAVAEGQASPAPAPAKAPQKINCAIAQFSLDGFSFLGFNSF